MTTSTSAEETKKAAHEFVRTKLQTQEEVAKVVALLGELGGGKTTFVQGVAKAFGIDATIISPTFVLERIYKIPNSPFKHLVHIDAYRLESEKELTALGWETLIKDPQNIILVEWADKIKKALPQERTTITFNDKGEDTREIIIT